MSVPAVSAQQRLVDRVRRRMRDFENLNRLIEAAARYRSEQDENEGEGGVENSDSMILEALNDALEDWNQTPPPLRQESLETHTASLLLVKGAVVELIDSVLLLLERNHLSVGDVGGIAINDGEMITLLTRHRAAMQQEYEQKKREHKAALNLSRALGNRDSSLASPYSLLP
jgi:hypothetical protein